MEIYIYYMDNITERIVLDGISLPVVSDCDILTASENFYHMDRTADFNVLIYVTDGEMYVTENENDYEISAGELLFLKHGIRHFGKTETLRGTRWFYAHFYLDERFSDEQEYLVLPKKISGLSGSGIEAALFGLSEHFHGNEPLKVLRNNAMLYDILLNVGCEQRPIHESLSDKICEYLDGQTDKDFSKQLISRRFYLSYSYLAAQFKREKGLSMGQYHNDARMKKACRLLRSTLMSIGEIADCLGFSDMLYFSKKFHAFSGMSPTEYRRQVQKKYSNK